MKESRFGNRDLETMGRRSLEMVQPRHLRRIAGQAPETPSCRKRPTRDGQGASVVLGPYAEIHGPGGLPVSEGKARRISGARPRS